MSSNMREETKLRLLELLAKIDPRADQLIEHQLDLRPGFLARARAGGDRSSRGWTRLRKYLDLHKDIPVTVIYEEAGANAHVTPGQSKSRSHMMIPDTQDGPGRPKQHLAWIGQYIVERAPDVVVHIGDHWDMASLSSYDGKGSRKMEGARYVADVESGNEGIEMLRAPARKAGLAAEFHLLRGNHEDRITRAIEEDPRLEGAIGLGDLKSPDWITHPFLDPVWLDGVCYSHYFYHPMTSRPWTGTIDNRLKQIGHSFSMGHQQTLLSGMRFVGGKQHRGLVAGACYLHDEDYKGPQGNAHWRGIICKHEVRDGQYDIMEVSLNYLCRRYEGCNLLTFMEKNKIGRIA